MDKVFTDFRAAHSASHAAASNMYLHIANQAKTINDLQRTLADLSKKMQNQQAEANKVHVFYKVTHQIAVM